MRKGEFTLQDFMEQMSRVRKLGPMDKVFGMIPGMENLHVNARDVEKQMDRMRGIYDAMSITERRNPDRLDPPRRDRIARGAGAPVREVDQFISQFETTRRMMRRVR
jgi:signal recognition particle subunit SRP54